MHPNNLRLRQLCAEEPFRVFFPIGVLLGGIGVVLWPLFYFGLIDTYPSSSHARLMVEGFVACFIFGFLGTAGPRVMSVQHFTGREVLRLLVAILAASLAHLTGHHTVGDGLFFIALVFLAASLVKRFRGRKDSPPPNFALVALGLLNGIVGAAAMFICEATNTAPDVFRLGASFLYIGFPVLPVLGVAPFFLRRLLDLPTDDATSEASRNWIPKAVFAIVVGLAIDASLVLEIFGSIPHVAWVRCAGALIYVGFTLPMRGNSLLAASLRMSLAALLAGLGLLALFPAYRIAGMHAVFIGGVTVAILSVATRVILGHSGALHLVHRRARWLGAALVFMILAMISRFSADFSEARNPHLIGAALCWLAGAAIWSAIVMPYIGRTEAQGV